MCCQKATFSFGAHSHHRHSTIGYSSKVVYKLIPAIYGALLTHMAIIWSNFVTGKLKIGILPPIVAKKQQRYGYVKLGNII